MAFLSGNAQHIGARGSQQDSFGFATVDGGLLAVVCDGMGGLEHGDVASRMAVEAFLNGYTRKTPGESIPEALERSVHEANDRVVEMAHARGAAECAGTTLVAAVFVDRRMYFISVGDSGLFHIRGGRIETLNRPHVFANLLDSAVARGKMTKEQALLHPERESLTSFIGVDVLEEIDHNVEPWPLEQGDSVLLASDGLFKTVTPAEILKAVEGHSPQAWPEALVARTLAKNYEFQDNVTVLSVTLKDGPPASPPAGRWLWSMISIAALLVAGAVLVIVLLPRVLHRTDAAPAPAAIVLPTPAPQNPQPEPEPAPPVAALSYETLTSRGAALVAAGNPGGAVEVYRQAVELQPENPEAYAALGELYLYEIGNLPEALKHYHAAFARGGAVTFRVRHDGGSDGRLILSSERVAFSASADSFEVPRGEVKEAKRNKGLFGHSSAFHIKLAGGKNYNFAPGSHFSDEERALILNLIGRG